MLQVALKMGVLRYELETLDEYVRGAEDDEGRTGRERILHRIATHFGVSRAWAKEAVLRVLNGGSIHRSGLLTPSARVAAMSRRQILRRCRRRLGACRPHSLPCLTSSRTSRR